MAQFRFTKQKLDSLPAATNPRGERYYDAKLPGFGVAKYPSGQVTFFVEYGQRRRRRRATLGRYGVLTLEQARRDAGTTLADVQRGGDPLEQRRALRGLPSFSEFAEQYLAQVEQRKRAPRHDKRYLTMASREWGRIPINQITRSQVLRIHHKVAEKTPTTANRWLASVRACLQEAVRLDLIPTNPASSVRPALEAEPRARVLSDAELQRVMASIDAETDPYVRAAFRLLIETGARKSEVLAAKWTDLDLRNGEWRIPRTKSGRSLTRPIPPSVAKVLTALPRSETWVFPGIQSHRADLRRAWDRVRSDANVADVRIHDLRRTFGHSVAREAGLHVASKLLGHSDVRVTERVYAPLGFSELRAATNKRSTQLRLLTKRKLAADNRRKGVVA